ncbi:hypothetical protein MRX96_021156 [Rhipicephalus microplus]
MLSGAHLYAGGPPVCGHLREKHRPHILVPKTEALVVHPHAEARRRLPCLQLDSAPIVWRSDARYLSFTVDNRLQWFPVEWPLRQTMRRVESPVSCPSTG